MKNNRKNGALVGSGLILAVTSSLCCITPLLAVLGGTGSAISAFSWLSPLRPYLLAATVIVLGIAFYNAYKPAPVDQCGCAERKSFMQSKKFLWTITLISLILSTFPYYEKYLKNSHKPTVSQGSQVMAITNATLKIEGMSCQACEGHVNDAVQHLQGVFQVSTSYSEGMALISYDSTKISLSQLADRIESETGYTAIP